MTRKAIVLASLISSFFPGAAHAGAALWPPVDAPISERFAAPSERYGPGHRGIDFAVPEGTVVRAAGDGTVAFAGEIPGGMAITIDHGDGLETTYTLLADVVVAADEVLRAGQPVGYAGEAHPGRPGLHFGVKLEGAYVDPEAQMAPVDISEAISLIPVNYDPPELGGRPLDVRGLTGRTPEGCIEARDLPLAPGPPNDNILVVIGGLTSTSDEEVLTDLPSRLGYPPERIYRFSYRGMDGLDLHTEYEAIDTFGDLRSAAAKFRRLLVEIGSRHPGVEVDVVAHSQGGIVVRSALELLEGAGRMPHVEHVATLATPHRGAPLAAALRDVDSGWGGLPSLLIELSGAPLPSMNDASVNQLVPGSDLLDALGGAVRPYGTRYLSLSTTNDLVVPADRGRLPGADRSEVLGPESWFTAHSSIVTSWQARARLFDHLRDGPATCRGLWDAIGPWIGAGIGALERGLGFLLGS